MRKLLFPLLFAASIIVVKAQNTGIGTTTPSPNALLHLENGALDLGLLLPNVDIAGFTPLATDEGLMVYDSVLNQIFSWDGSAWQPAGGGSSWDLTGNTGTVDGVDFIGTTDNIPLSFRVNNQSAGRLGNSATSSTAFGFNALNLNTNSENTAIGSNAGALNTTGFRNTAVGSGALQSNVIGNANVAIGNIALRDNLASENTAVGRGAMNQNTTGTANVAVGFLASDNNTTSDNNTAVGHAALTNSVGSNNTSIGKSSMLLNGGGSQNVAVGVLSMQTNTFGNSNTTIGYQSDVGAAGLNNATAIGANAVVSLDNSLVLGNNVSVGIGTNSPDPNYKLDVVGDDIRINGVRAGLGGGAVTSNAAFGINALNNNTSGNRNAAFGFNSLSQNTTGERNTALGDATMDANVDGSANTAVGSEALGALTTGGPNTAVGANSMSNTTSGGENAAFGHWSLFGNTTGGGNTALGDHALQSNTIGTDNIGIGRYSDVGSGNLSNAIAIGSYSRVDQSNALILGSINGVNTATNTANVGIATTTPNVNADLTLGSNDRGLQLNRVDASQISGLAALDRGLIYYDSIANQILYWNGTDFDTLGNSSAGGEPVGTIMAFAGGAIPPGYLACDGALISRTTYADLFAAIGTAWGTTNATNFRVPDLRGKFMRGVSGGSGFDPDAGSRIAQYTGGNGGNAVGSYQLDAFQDHQHQSNIVHNVFGTGAFANQATSGGAVVGGFSLNGPASNVAGSRTSSETRPVNLYVNYIIKYQPGATAGGGGGTVTSITAGTGLTGGTITTTGTIALDNSGVTAGTYGSSTQSPQITVDAFGRVTAVSNQAIAAATSSWDILGNAGTIDGTNFIGTTDNIPLNFRVNNVPAGRIDHIQFNAAFGRSTLQSNTAGTHNTAVGNNAMIVNSTGARNAAFGSQALQNGNSNDNVAIGWRSLMAAFGGSNTAVGYQTGNLITSGSLNTLIGYDADVTVNNLTNATAIGANASVDVSNALVLGNNANVGIGVSAPVEKLHISSAAGSTGMIITNDFLGTSATDGLIVGISGSNTATINNRENGSLLIGTNGLPNINQLVLDPSGNVGIDITPPTEKLHVNGNLRFDGALMPNNLPGAAGEVLTSGGPGVAPTWTSGTGFTVAGNGLSSSGNTVDLGGTLTQNTNIDRNDYAFTVGTNNTITGPQNGEIMFGYDNTVSGFGGIAIGTGNTVGGNRGIAIGNYAEANHLGSFVMGDWSGSAPGLTASSTSDQFTARFNSGYRFYATSDPISNPNTGMFINNAGFVGIGTNNPGSNQLSVVTQASNGSAGYFENNIASGIDGSALRVLNSGVRSIGHYGMLIQNLVTKVGGSNSTKIGLKIESTGAWGVATVNQPNIGLDVTVSGADNNYAAIFNGGSVGIGTTSPGGALDVNGIAIVRTVLNVGDYGTNQNVLQINTFTDGAIPSNSWSQIQGNQVSVAWTNLVLNGAGGNVGIGEYNPTFRLHVNGSVAGVGAYNNLSDKRFKKNLEPIDNALNKILSLNGISFEWDTLTNPKLNLDNNRHLGFLAQDVEKILPLVVNTSNDSLNTKTVEYSSIVPVLVEAIKEQQAIIELQKSQIESLQVLNSEHNKSDDIVQNKLNLLQAQIDQLNAILSMEAKK